jgi:hypothetical protein
VRKAFVVALIAIAVLAIATKVWSAQAAPSKLTGPMTKMQYLIGTWSCQTKLPAEDKMPARTMPGTVYFSVEPGNTVGYYLSSKEYSSGGYMGWMASKKLWWSSSADNFGGTAIETGTDSNSRTATMTGTMTMQGQNAPTRDTITKVSDTKYRDLAEVQKNGTWTMQADSTCTKTSNKTM